MRVRLLVNVPGDLSRGRERRILKKRPSFNTRTGRVENSLLTFRSIATRSPMRFNAASLSRSRSWSLLCDPPAPDSTSPPPPPNSRARLRRITRGGGVGEGASLSNDVHHANGVVRERGSGHPRGCGRGARAKESRRPRRAGIPRGRARERARERERGRADLGSWFAYIRGLRAARNNVRRRSALDCTRTRTSYVYCTAVRVHRRDALCPDTNCEGKLFMIPG